MALPSEITNVGVAGILVLLLLDRILPFVKSQRNGNGENKTLQFLEAQVVPILQGQTDILRRLEAITTTHHDDAMKVAFQVQQTADAIDKLRSSNHAIVNRLQRVPDKCPFAGASLPDGVA